MYLYTFLYLTVEKSALLKTEDPKNTPSNTQLTTSTTNGPLPNNQTIQKLTTESTQNFTTSTNKTLKLLFYIEATFIYNFYYQYHPCNSALRKATLLSNLNLQLTGCFWHDNDFISLFNFFCMFSLYSFLKILKQK